MAENTTDLERPQALRRPVVRGLAILWIAVVVATFLVEVELPGPPLKASLQRLSSFQDR